METAYGWTGRILKVDLSSRTATCLETAAYSSRFIGGLGIAQKIYWDESSPRAEAFDPSSPLIIMTGPLAGTIAPSAPRIAVCGKSPCTRPERFVTASAAGFFPAELKKAGFDGIVITGTADSPVYLDIADGSAVICDAAHVWGTTNSVARSVIAAELGGKPTFMSIGPGAENGSRIGTLLIDLGGSASMGFGSVMGSKRLKAIAVRGSGRVPVANRSRVDAIRKQLHAMTGPGFYNIYGNPVPVPGNDVVRKVHCHGCSLGCWRTLQRRPSGIEGIRKCQTATYYARWDKQYNGEISDISFQATELANEYSLCVTEMLFLLLWLERACAGGILDENRTGLARSQMGTYSFIESFIKSIAAGTDFGGVLSQGALRASERFGSASRAITADFLNDAGRPAVTYGPKTFVISAPIFATEQRPSITELHEICNPLTKWALWLKTGGRGSYVSTEVLRAIADRFWGGRDAVDFSTPDGKARAACIVQNREYAKESLILCDFVFPVLDDASTGDHVGDPTIESRLYSAVTGNPAGENDLNRAGERIFNLNRAIQLREGRRGREDDILHDICYIEREEPPSDIFDMYNPERNMPGKGDELISRRTKAIGKAEFKKMMDDYYALRGWDTATGLPTRATLARLDLEDIAGGLAGSGRIAQPHDN